MRRSFFVLVLASCSLHPFRAMSGVVVNEVCWKNEKFDDGTGSLTSDWVELYNGGPAPVDVGGYALGKKKRYADCAGRVCTLPAYTLDPGEFLVVYFDKDLPPATNWVETVVNGRAKRVPWVRSNAFSLGTTEAVSALYQDDVRLFDNTAGHNRVSNVKGEDVAVVLDKNTSYGSLWDGDVDARGETSDEGWVVFASPTPWASNAAGFTMAAPSLSAGPGVYPSRLSLTATCPDARATMLYYTLDGTDPRTSSTRRSLENGGVIAVDARANATAASGMGQTNAWIRTSPVELAASVPGADWRAPVGSVPRLTPLRVVAAYGPGFSAEAGGVYCVGSEFAARGLPIVALTVDPDDFFSPSRGIYVPGAVYTERGFGSHKWGKPNANYFADDAEVRAHLELLEADAAHPALSVDLGVSPAGGGLSALPQKALVCALRGSEYGVRDLTYGLIPALGVKTYKRFVLDNGGRDWSGPLTDGVSTLLKDVVLHRIASGLGLASAHRPASVYVNGDYWGLHMIRESAGKHAFATRYGLDADNIDLLAHELDGSSSDIAVVAVEGDEAAVADYEAFLTRLDAVDVSTASGFAVATEAMDVANYTDYVVAETFFANDDWPSENCQFWRTRTNELDRADAFGDGRWRWRLSDLDLAGKEKDGVQGAWRDMFAFLSAKDMRDRDEAGFLVNRLWKNEGYREAFVARYVKLLETDFHPDRTAAIVRDEAGRIAAEVVRHYRRWGRTFTQEQWTAAVERSLVDYLALRWTNSFEHLSAKFNLGGVADLTLTCEAGGTLRVDGETVEGRVWTGRRFAGRPVEVTAVPPDGFVFSEWSDGVQDASRSVRLTAGGALALSATFVRSSELFEVRFDPNGGAGEMEPRTVSSASRQTLPVAAFTRDGFAFVGWATSATGPVAYADGAAVREIAAVPGREVTLYAVWAATTYQVVFKANGGEGEMAPRTFGTGVPQILDDCAFVREGYTFAGWALSADGAVVHRAGAEVVDLADGEDATLYAVWSRNVYTIEFDANGGVGAREPVTVAYGASASCDASGFSRVGHVFAGWALDPEGPVAYAPGEAVSNLTACAGASVLLYAIWDRTLLFPEDETSGVPQEVEAPWLSAAVVYDGYVADAENGLRGTLKVKVGKANRRTRLSKVTVVFTPADGTRKATFRNGRVGSDGRVRDWTQNGRTLCLTLGVRGMGGRLNDWLVDGARNLFTSKFAAEKQEAGAVLACVKPGCAFAWPEPAVAGSAPGTGWSGLSAVVGTRGKTKVSGTLAAGTKVSVSGQLLIGDARVCIPVVSPRKTPLAFGVWGTRTDLATGVEVVGLGDVVAGRIGGAFSGRFELCDLPDGFRFGSGGYEGWRPRVTAKSGALKGTFKVYASAGGKYRKTSVSVAGVVVDGVGYGTAVVRRRASWAVLLR